MKKGLSITLVLGIVVASAVVVSASVMKVYKLQAEVISLEKKLADTEGARTIKANNWRKIK